MEYQSVGSLITKCTAVLGVVGMGGIPQHYPPDECSISDFREKGMKT